MKNVVLASMWNTLLAVSEFQSVGDILASFFKEWWGPMLIVLASLGGILGIVAGVRIWAASASGDENKLKSAKSFLIYILIGFAVVFVLAALVPVLVAAFGSWFNANS